MEIFPTSEEQHSYDSLKKALLNGSISINECVDKLDTWDQSTPSRDAADENLKFLSDPQIIEYVGQHPEAQNEYYGFLSFTEFHIAQRLSVSDPTESTHYLKKALASAKLNRLDGGWMAYVEGTLLYRKGKRIPEELIARVDLPKNVEILRDYNERLKK